MPLPITKGQFNRLGDRLIAGKSPSQADQDELQTVLTAYQAVLEQVKAHLRDLGFAPGDRVKTTPTILDKLRRIRGMELSRVQDLAGARITVRNLAAQDGAAAKISEFYAAQGCPWRQVDRRTDPRFGYRAVHLVVNIEELPVEIQIRTELQDSWAQIVERLADRWGRGIRYGEDPENPEGIVRSGESVYSRREFMTSLMTLSDLIWSAEQGRRLLDSSHELLRELDSIWDGFLRLPEPDPSLLASKIPPDLALSAGTRTLLNACAEELDAEAREALDAGADMTVAQLRHLIGIAIGFVRRNDRVLSAKLADDEQRLRDTLQLVADATDEGE